MRTIQGACEFWGNAYANVVLSSLLVTCLSTHSEIFFVDWTAGVTAQSLREQFWLKKAFSVSVWSQEMWLVCLQPLLNCNFLQLRCSDWDFSLTGFTDSLGQVLSCIFVMSTTYVDDTIITHLIFLPFHFTHIKDSTGISWFFLGTLIQTLCRI